MGFEGRGMGEAIAILQYSATVFSCSSDVVGISCFGLAAEVGIAAILFSICLLLRPWAILCFFCIALWCIWGERLCLLQHSKLRYGVKRLFRALHLV